MFRSFRSACCSCLIACLIAIGAAYVIVPPLLKTHPPEQPLPQGLASGYLVFRDCNSILSLDLASGGIENLHTTDLLLSRRGDWALCVLHSGYTLVDHGAARSVSRPQWLEGEVLWGPNLVSPTDDRVAGFYARVGQYPEPSLRCVAYLDVNSAQFTTPLVLGAIYPRDRYATGGNWCMGPGRDEVCRVVKGRVEVLNATTGAVRLLGRGRCPAASGRGDVAFVAGREQFAIIASDGSRREFHMPKVRVTVLRWSPDSRFLMYLYSPLPYLGMPNLGEYYEVGVLDTHDGRNYRVIPGRYGGREVGEYSTAHCAPPQWVERLDPRVLKILQRECPDSVTATPPLPPAAPGASP
ncbi:MAG: hypothetical protein ACYC63_08575 [Armatimonadota bacterium]